MFIRHNRQSAMSKSLLLLFDYFKSMIVPYDMTRKQHITLWFSDCSEHLNGKRQKKMEHIKWATKIQDID